MKILLVRLRLIGDVVFTTPVIRALRRQYPAARIAYLVETAARPVVADNPHLSDVITVAHSRGWQRIADDVRLARRLRRARFDVAIDMHGGPRSAWLTWASRAPVRVGYDVPGRSWMYTHVAPRSREHLPRHAVENQWDLIATLDPAFAAGPSPERDRVEMQVGTAARERTAAALAGLGIPGSARLTVVHVSAGNPFRRWPEPAFAELVSGLVASAPDRWVLVTGGPSDREAAARVVAGARAQAGAAGARVVGGDDFSLAELRALFDRAALFIGGDSGPLHIAATSDVPIVGLYGPTLPKRSAPWRAATLPVASVEDVALPCRPCDQRACAPGDFRCLAHIPAAAVLTAATRLLEASR